MLAKSNLQLVYDRLFQVYGPQSWWPAETPFEVMVGAILTQNTAWTNVEKAITNLKRVNCLDHRSLIEMRERKLAELIRPSGYFNIKARRLKNFCHWFAGQGGHRSLKRLHTRTLRERLLEVNGIGPETADDIVLYAFDRPVFVIDAYTRRLFQRLGLIQGDEPYDTLRSWFEQALQRDVQLFNEYHALIVRHAKEKCRATEDCGHCLVESATGISI